MSGHYINQQFSFIPTLSPPFPDRASNSVQGGEEEGVSYAISSLFHYSVTVPPRLSSCCFRSHVKVTEVNVYVWKYFNWLVTGTVVSSLDFEAINCFLLVHCFMGSLEISLSGDLSSFNSQDNGEVWSIPSQLPVPTAPLVPWQSFLFILHHLSFFIISHLRKSNGQDLSDSCWECINYV